MSARIDFTAKELLTIERLYVQRKLTVQEIGDKFGCSDSFIVRIARKHRWAARVRAVPTKPRTAPDYRAEMDARHRQLYGDVAGDVDYLRQRGFVVTREKSGYRVGNALCDLTELRAKADRERRLSAPPAPGIASVPVWRDTGRTSVKRPTATSCACGRARSHLGRYWYRRGWAGPKPSNKEAA